MTEVAPVRSMSFLVMISTGAGPSAEVRLIADGTQSENVHEIEIEGSFGRMRLDMRNQPLPENPKTSMLTVLSALRFVHNRVAAVTV